MFSLTLTALSSMDCKRHWHICFFCGIKKFNKILQWSIFMVMTATAGIGLFVNTASLYTLGRGDKLERMAVLVPFCFRHMACYATAKGMNPVCCPSLQCLVALHAEIVCSQFCRGYARSFLPDIVNTVTGSAHNPCLCVLAL